MILFSINHCNPCLKFESPILSSPHNLAVSFIQLGIEYCSADALIERLTIAIPTERNNITIMRIVGFSWKDNAISVHYGCAGAFCVVFDNHVTSVPTKVCNFMAIQIILKPGGNITRSTLNSVLGFTAVSPGATNATVTISYIVGNQTGANMSFNGNPINSSKSFLFEISNQSAQTIPAIPSPFTQIKSGIAANDVKCQQDLQLVIKAEDGSPACVLPDTATKLLDRGWAKNSG